MKKIYLICGIILLIIIIGEIYFLKAPTKPQSNSLSNLSNIQTNSEVLLPTFGNCSKLSLGWKCDIDSGSVKYYNNPDNYSNFLEDLDINYKNKYCPNEEKQYFTYVGTGSILSLFCINKVSDAGKECNSSKECTTRICSPVEDAAFDENFTNQVVGSREACPNCIGECNNELDYVHSIGASSWVEYNKGYLEVKGN